MSTRVQDATGLGRRIGWSVLGSMIGLATSTLAMLGISRGVSADEYGRVAVIMATLGIVMNALTWCGGLLMRFGPIELESTGSLRQTISARLVFATPIAFLLVGTPLWLWHRAWSTLLVGMAIVWLLVATAYDVSWWSAIAAQRFRALALGNALTKGAVLPLLMVAAATGLTLRAEHIFAATILGTAATTAVLAFVLRGAIGIARPDWSLVRKMWRFSLPGLLGMPALGAIAWLDPIILDLYVSKGDVGRFQLAATTITVFAALGSSVNAVFSPDLVRAGARGAPAVLETYLGRSQPRLALALPLLAMSAACVAPAAVRIVVGAQFAAMGDVVAMLAVAGGFLLVTYSILPVVNATDAVWSQQIAYTVQAVLNVALDILLAPRWGTIGVGIANVIAWWALSMTLTLLLRRRLALRIWPLVVMSPLAVGVIVAIRVPGPAKLIVAAILLACAARLIALELRSTRLASASASG